MDTGDAALEPVEECVATSMQLQLSDYPGLSMVGGSAVSLFQGIRSYFNRLRWNESMDCEVWKICTHGTCDVEWADDLGLVRCPCHNSLFDWDGTVPRTGNQTSSLIEVCLDDDASTLHIQRNE